MMSRMTINGLAAVVLCFAPSARADLLLFHADLDGPSESPPVASPGTGTASVEIDTLAHTMRVKVRFQDLLFPTTVAHIHAPTLDPLTGNASVATGVPTFLGFPAGVTAGFYDHEFDLLDLATYNPAFVTLNGGTAASAEVALISALLDKKAYLNVHSSGHPTGEIRGFLQLVPEPSSVGLMLLGGLLIGVGGLRGRRAFPR